MNQLPATDNRGVDLPIYICRRAASGIAIDGCLDEPAWRETEAVSLSLHDGSGAPRLETLARLCYDDTYLYVAFECRDAVIQANWTSRDDPIFDEEVVEVFLDPDSDEATYYEFEVSPRNVVFDAVVSNPSGRDPDIDTTWDCTGLITAVSAFPAPGMSEQSWLAEMAFPFSSLQGAAHTPPQPGDRWRANLYRIEREPREEYTCWSPTLAVPAAFHRPALFGILQFE